jgi:hypothetical protein
VKIAERRLFRINSLAERMLLLKCAGVLRAWRHLIDLEIRLEVVAGKVAARWRLVRSRWFFGDALSSPHPPLHPAALPLPCLLALISPNLGGPAGEWEVEVACGKTRGRQAATFQVSAPRAGGTPSIIKSPGAFCGAQGMVLRVEARVTRRAVDGWVQWVDVVKMRRGKVHKCLEGAVWRSAVGRAMATWTSKHQRSAAFLRKVELAQRAQAADVLTAWADYCSNIVRQLSGATRLSERVAGRLAGAALSAWADAQRAAVFYETSIARRRAAAETRVARAGLQAWHLRAAVRKVRRLLVLRRRARAAQMLTLHVWFVWSASLAARQRAQEVLQHAMSRNAGL